MVTRVFVDANVLFSRTLRDWLFLLKLRSNARMFTVASSLDVIAETIARVRDSKPLASGAMTANLKRRIEGNLDEVIEEFDNDGSFPGADVEDVHVHAAAVGCGADILLTSDNGWSDLTPDESDNLPYDAYHPDDFFCLVDDSAPQCVRQVVTEQLQYWHGRDGDVNLSERLKAAGCPNFAKRVRQHLLRIDSAVLRDQ